MSFDVAHQALVSLGLVEFVGKRSETLAISRSIFKRGGPKRDGPTLLVLHMWKRVFPLRNKPCILAPCTSSQGVILNVVLGAWFWFSDGSVISSELHASTQERHPSICELSHLLPKQSPCFLAVQSTYSIYCESIDCGFYKSNIKIDIRVCTMKIYEIWIVHLDLLCLVRLYEWAGIGV